MSNRPHMCQIVVHLSDKLTIYATQDEKCGCINDIDSPEVHGLISNKLKRRNINEAWFPLKKVTFYEWRWLDSNPYGRWPTGKSQVSSNKNSQISGNFSILGN